MKSMKGYGQQLEATKFYLEAKFGELKLRTHQ
jgi:hypothetical protein